MGNELKTTWLQTQMSIDASRPKQEGADDLPVIPPLPPGQPRPLNAPIARCGECGREVYGVEGYVCHNRRCPVYPQITA